MLTVIMIDDKGNVHVQQDDDLHVEPYDLRDQCFKPCGCCGDAVIYPCWNSVTDTCTECNAYEDEKE